MKKRIYLMAFLVCSLYGCETYYRAPTTADTAKVRFAATAPSQSIMVSAFENERCDLGTSGGIMGVVGGVNIDPRGAVPAGVKSAGNTLGMIGYSEASGIKPIERVVPGGKPFIFGIFRIDVGNSVISTCKLSLTFVPASGQEYEVDYIEDDVQCYLNVFRLELNPAGSVERIPELSARKTEKICSGLGAN